MESPQHPSIRWPEGRGDDQLPVIGDLQIVRADYAPDSQGDADEASEEMQERRVLLPAALFLATCVTTFWTGAQLGLTGGGLHGVTTAWWQDALVYMLAVMGILLAHEMGHFLQAVRYRVPASLPFFIPMPPIFTPAIGTMGAVIGLGNTQADRKQLFDIGLTGPIAGLLVAIPVTWAGIKYGQPFIPQPGLIVSNYADPLLVQWMIAYLRPDIPDGNMVLNPLLLAGWVGMLITGLNMLPVSQLDGGHVIYSLFGKQAHLIARAFIFVAIAFIVLSNQLAWIAMLILVMLIGADHPPTADDTVSLGWFRRLVGVCSLAIPVLCFTPIPFSRMIS